MGRLERYRCLQELYSSHANENLISKEKYKLNLGGITISGPSGTGKTTLARLAAERYQIPNQRNIKIGDLMRKAQNKQKEEGAIERPLNLDEQMDQSQRTLIQQATINEPFILEGRLSGFITKQEREKNPNLPVISILLTASYNKSIERIKKRNPSMTENEIAQKSAERAANDLQIWKGIHPELNDPYNPAYYDIIINTDSLNPQEVLEHIHNELLQRGKVKN